MRNNFLCILIICAVTNSFAKDEEEKPPVNDIPPVKEISPKIAKHTREYYEEEAKIDMENLLSGLRDRHFNNEDDAELLNINAARSSRQMERIDEIVDKPKTKNNVNSKLRTNAQLTAGNFKQAMQHEPSNIRNRRSSNAHNYVNDNQFQQLMNNFNSGFLKNRISGGHNVNNLLRNHVNQVNLKPEVYPLVISDDKYGSREIMSKEILLTDQFYSNDKLINQMDTNHNNETLIRTATIPISDNFDINELLTQLQSKHGEDIPTRKESNNKVLLNDLYNFYSNSANHLRPGNRLENFDELQGMADSEVRDKTKTIFLRSDLDVNSDNKPLDEFMKYLEIGKNSRTSPNTLFQRNIPQPAFLRQAKQGSFRSRRSTNTQAGYTQDPDTCKTYNENLVKLWSNLSKLINVTEQPNEKALHNIAMMIQAYLEHQNAKQVPEIHKIKHEGPRNKISEIMLKIRKLFDEGEDSAEKITKIIIKYLKPDYADVQSEDCQEVNEETLGLSVDLLYKNYLETKNDCNSDDDGMARNNKVSLRKQTIKTGKSLASNGHATLSNSDFKPEIQTIFMDDELYKDFHKGRIPRHRPTNRNRRVLRQSRKHRSRLQGEIYRSGNQNESDKSKLQSKASRNSASKKLKKNSLKSQVVMGTCEKFATRKLIVSLRPVMERFMGLLECQLDNTLRSKSFGRVSDNPYYLYASKFYSHEDSRRHRKILPHLLARNTGVQKYKSHKTIQTKRQDNSVENDQDGLLRNDETDSASVRKYSFDKIKGINYAPPAVARDTDAQEVDTENNKQQQHSDDYITTHHEYFQSPPLYDEYDGIYKTHKQTNSLTNDKKHTRDKSTHKKLASSDKERDTENEKSNEYDIYSESNSEESRDVSDMEQQTESNLSIETPFIDFTKLRSDDQLIEEKSQIHVKNYESITDFLKKARDASMQTPEFALPFALDTKKGYVELTHLIKYPKIIVYRPQFLVKNTMPYDDFLKTINNINMTNDEVRLMKIVRHLPDSSVQVLFETEDFEAPLEVRNLNDNRRSGSPDPVVNYQLESRIDTASEHTKADFPDGDSEDYVPIYRNEAFRQILDALLRPDSSSNGDYLPPDRDLNLGSGTLRSKEELFPNMYSDLNSDTNPTLNIIPFSSESTSSAVKSVTDVGFDTGFNLDLKLTPIRPSQFGSFYSKLLPSSYSNSNPNLSIDSHIDSYSESSTSSLSSSNSYSQLNSDVDSLSTNSDSHSLLPYTDSSNTEVENSFPSSTQSIILGWWKKWKNIIKGKMKQIIGKMASLTDKIDHIVTA